MKISKRCTEVSGDAERSLSSPLVSSFAFDKANFLSLLFLHACKIHIIPTYFLFAICFIANPTFIQYSNFIIYKRDAKNALTITLFGCLLRIPRDEDETEWNELRHEKRRRNATREGEKSKGDRPPSLIYYYFQKSSTMKQQKMSYNFVRTSQQPDDITNRKTTVIVWKPFKHHSHKDSD